MLHIDKWAEGRPLFLAAFAQSMAAFPDFLTGLVKLIISGNFPHKEFPAVSLQEWLCFYKNHRRIWRVITAAFSLEDAPELEALQRINASERQDNSPADFDAFSAKNQTLFEHLYRQNLGRLQDDILSRNALVSDQSATQNSSQITDNSEIHFLLRIWLPCYFLYSTSPPLLLRMARQGNAQALDRLLRLDKSTIFDPKIARQFHDAARSQTSQFDQLIGALKKPPRGIIQKRKIKVSLAAFIWVIFEGCGYKLEEPEIRALFDAVAKDQGCGAIDTDIPESPHAFYMAIQRELPPWQKIFKSHKK